MSQRVDKVDTQSRCLKMTVYFVKLFSSAYVGTVENNFAESKQWYGFLDENRTIFILFYIIPAKPKIFFVLVLLAVDRGFSTV